MPYNSLSHVDLPNISTRLVLYKRIAQAQDLEALNDIQVEMIDRCDAENGSVMR